jgi:hypothetical protein
MLIYIYSRVIVIQMLFLVTKQQFTEFMCQRDTHAHVCVGVCGCGCVGVWVWVCGCVGVGVSVIQMLFLVTKQLRKAKGGELNPKP